MFACCCTRPYEHLCQFSSQVVLPFGSTNAGRSKKHREGEGSRALRRRPRERPATVALAQSTDTRPGKCERRRGTIFSGTSQRLHRRCSGGPQTAAKLQQKFRLLYGKNGVRHFPKFRLGEETQRNAEVLNCNASLFFEYPEESGIAGLQEIYRSLRKGSSPTGFSSG